MKNNFVLAIALLAISPALGIAKGSESYTWRNYRPGNTGIQGDYNECIWIGADNDPWIGGYDPQSQEGGVAKFLQAQNKWLNISNVDYPEIGSANDTGYPVIKDIISDNSGNIWIATMRGVLRMNLAQGASSLKRFDATNSMLPGGAVADMTLAPDGTIWMSSYSTLWGGGGLTRYNPGTNAWSHMDGHGGYFIAAQPKSSGGYYIWASQPGYEASPVERWDSSTQTWASFPVSSGNPSHLICKDSVDASGNPWVRRYTDNQFTERLEVLRPNGTWLVPNLPTYNGNIAQAALAPYGNMQCLMVDGFMQLQSYNGTSWTNLGPVPHNAYIDDLDRAQNGDIWLCGTGTGGALKRTASTGAWQRHRITNSSQFDLFNKQIALDPNSNKVYACANASPDIGGMTMFDGTRWKGFVTGLDYGLGGPWPFTNSPQSEAIYVRKSNSNVIVNPVNGYTAEFNGISWTQYTGGPDQVQNYAEDSTGRLWVAGHYGGIGYFVNGNYVSYAGGSWFNTVHKDPKRAGTVWLSSDFFLSRVDGNGYSFNTTIDDFPTLAAKGASLGVPAIDANGVAWVGTYSPSDMSGNALLKIDPNTGTKQIVSQYSVNWPFRGQYVTPLTVSPDGKVWMAYGKEYPFDDMGIVSWDGKLPRFFPAPPNGEWRWGGLPHYIISNVQVRKLTDGYELWMGCFTRGIAVLTVKPNPPLFKLPAN